MNCPLDCEYLLEARRREKMRQVVDPEEIANPTIWFQAAGQPYTGAFTVHDLYLETGNDAT